jgi:hypothetical protein
MAWIKSHQELRNHPKLVRLASKLRINKCQAIGHLHFLWWWALDYAPKGDISAFTSAEITAASDWAGDPAQFDRALHETGWIDDNKKLHDWKHYGGKYLKTKIQNRKRQQAFRRRESVTRDTCVSNAYRVEESRGEKRREEKSLPLEPVLPQNNAVVDSKATKFNRLDPPNPNPLLMSDRDSDVLDEFVSFTADGKSRAFYQSMIKNLGNGMAREALREVKMRSDTGEVRDRAAYLTTLLLDWSAGKEKARSNTA